MKMIKVTEVRVGYYTPDLDEGNFYWNNNCMSVEEVVEFDKEGIARKDVSFDDLVQDNEEPSVVTFEIVDTIK